MGFPKHMYRKADNARGFESIVAKNQEHLEAMNERHGKHFDSPADFGVETHPNPDEVKRPPAKQALEGDAGPAGKKGKQGAAGGDKS